MLWSLDSMLSDLNKRMKGIILKKILNLIAAITILGTSNFAYSNDSEILKTNTSSTKEVADIVNKERRRYGLKPLIGNSKLSQVAGAHAKDMYRRDYFSHSSIDGRTMGDRLRERNVPFKIAGENIARGQQTAKRVMQAWMNSPGHRKNILNRKYGKIGIARAGNVWVQNFSN